MLRSSVAGQVDKAASTLTNGKGSDAGELLRLALADGPRDSRDVAAAAIAAGVTAKQLRVAREQLGVETKRIGRRDAMRSWWALPGPAPTASADGSTSDADEQCGTLRFAKAAAESPALTDDELTRVQRRAAFFQSRGLAPAPAVDLAASLVLERDRMSSRSGSCAECQLWRGPLEHECPPAIRRAPSEIWYCPYRRNVGP